MQHGGLYENTNFSCVAENEAGRTTKRVQVIVTGGLNFKSLFNSNRNLFDCYYLFFTSSKGFLPYSFKIAEK